MARPLDDQILKALDHLRDNVPREIKVSDLARHYGVSASYFSWRFRRETGLGPRAMLTALRMERAREFLARTNLGLKEISSALGYQTASAFGRVFLRVNGETPNYYRRVAKQSPHLVGNADDNCPE